MSSKLLGSLQSRFNKVFTLKFGTVWCDKKNYIHIVLYGNEFLSDEDISIAKSNTKELLIHNKWNNLKLWCTCLPYELKNQPSDGYALAMDYVILISVRPQNFSANGMDLLPDKEQFLNELYYNDLLIEDHLMTG